nr:hypothetical protein CFP56_51540 [Quercus suber]
MAVVPAQSRDEFGPSPNDNSVLRFITTHRSCAVWEGKEDLPPDDAYGPPFAHSPLSIKTVWVMTTKNSPQKICLVQYRQLLDCMRPNQVVWEPYQDDLAHLPPFYVAGRDVASHKQMLTQYTVGSPMYKHILAVLKYVERLHRITAKLPLEETDGANPDATEDTGRPSTSSNRASHSHGQYGAPHQVVSRSDPPPPPHASPMPKFPPPPHASPAPEFPPRPHASPSPDIPPRTAYAIPD